MGQNTKTLTTNTFDAEVLKSDKPVLVDFWATWCMPCKMVAPILEDLAGEMAEKLVIGKLDVDQNPEVAARYGIMSIPTMILYQNGKEVARMMGAMPKAAIKQKLDASL